MFIDEVTLQVEAGRGGDGCTSFRREKYVPLGGPDGGDGGRGADIIFEVDEGLHTLLDLRYQKKIIGKKGENGKGKNKHGKSMDSVIIKVPQGTVITDMSTDLILGDLKDKNDRIIVAKGGRGGRGNASFKTAANTAPSFSEKGEPGEVRMLKIELKLLADVGLVGLPSVGKSTIISKISKAKPKIAEYHFTTLTPNLGLVKASNNQSFVMADLPGLIKGASEGVGLGDRFLRHIERTKLIVHVVDMSGNDGVDPYTAYQTINAELQAFSEKLINKPQVIVANKMDMPSSSNNLKKFKTKVKDKIFEVSAITGLGLQELVDYLAQTLTQIDNEPLYEDDKFESHVIYTFQKEQPYTISKDDDVWVISGDMVEKLFKMTNFNQEEGAYRFARKLQKLGIDDKLRELGCKDGDTVRILDFYFDFRE